MNAINYQSFLTGAGALVTASPLEFRAEGANFSKKRSLRIAHLTDVHVMPGRDSQEGMAKALRHAQSLTDKPDFILNGGDCIMDALKGSKNEVKAQWSEWNRVLENELKIPMHSAIGNHDIWGWGSADRLKNAGYGKRWAMDELGLANRHYSFAQNGWKFIVLDSTFFLAESDRGYTAKLDDLQFEWLAGELNATHPNTPICILSHIPIISFCPIFDGDNEATGSWKLPGPWMHIDARRIKDLFRKHKNVKTCLSGHIHMQDEVNYLGVKYLCNGAVSGNWWEGSYQEFPPAYAIIDLFDDGSVESSFISYL